jgi:hypothetical protein
MIGLNPGRPFEARAPMMPTVLHFIVCDRVRMDAQNLHAISVDGLKWSIRSKQVPSFPLVVPQLSVLAVFMGGDGRGEVSLQIVHGGSRRVLSRSQRPRPIHFNGDPESVHGLKVFLTNCTFPEPGLYWVELVLFGQTIAKQPLVLFP